LASPKCAKSPVLFRHRGFFLSCRPPDGFLVAMPLASPYSLAQPGRIHVIGAGGLAIGGLALALAERGWSVTASDQNIYGPAVEEFAAAGITVNLPCREENLPGKVDVVLAGGTHLPDNPELRAARARGLPVLTFPEFLGAWFPAACFSVLVAGTNGKTSTSAMLVRLLHANGIRPSYLIGGRDKSLPGTVGLENDQLAVLEADESRCARWLPEPKFLHLPVTSVILTSLAPDHPESFASDAAYFAAFRALLRRVPKSGWILAHAADLDALGPLETKAKIIRVARNGADHDFCSGDKPGTFRLDGETLSCGVAGEHMVANAALAVLAARRLGAGDARAIADFRGVAGRSEVLTENPLPVLRDEGYHPVAITATLASARQRFPGRRWHLVHRPRYLGGLERPVERDLPASLAMADVVHLFVEETFADEPLPVVGQWKAETIAGRVRSLGTPATCHRDLDAFITALRPQLAPGDAILFSLPGNFAEVLGVIAAHLPRYPAFAGDAPPPNPSPAP
jgi:UDP-N-acetylmuramate: L-alanyl-gamma-D-glutamyl-meso-diaminopimelate ligase